MVSLARKTYRACRNSFLSRSHRLGSALLRRPGLRRRLNQAHERFGATFEDVFDRLFNGSRVPSAFAWECSFAGRGFKVPVFPEHQRSWNNACYWRWWGSRPVRRFLEFYLRERPTGVLFDVGANDGVYTYPFAAHGYVCVGFEPQPACVDYIRRTCAENGFSGVTVEPVAVSHTPADSVVFHVSDSSWFSSLVKENVERLEPSRPISVRVITLDDYHRAHEGPPTMVKIDVEGGEWDVLRGGSELFRAARPDVLIEVDLKPENVEHVYSFFKDHGYHLYHVPSARPSYARAKGGGTAFAPIEGAREVLAAGAGTHADVIALADPELARAFERWASL